MNEGLINSHFQLRWNTYSNLHQLTSIFHLQSLWMSQTLLQRLDLLLPFHFHLLLDDWQCIVAATKLERYCSSFLGLKCGSITILDFFDWHLIIFLLFSELNMLIDVKANVYVFNYLNCTYSINCFDCVLKLRCYVLVANCLISLRFQYSSYALTFTL